MLITAFFLPSYSTKVLLLTIIWEIKTLSSGFHQVCIAEKPQYLPVSGLDISLCPWPGRIPRHTQLSLFQMWWWWLLKDTLHRGTFPSLPCTQMWSHSVQESIFKSNSHWVILCIYYYQMSDSIFKTDIPYFKHKKEKLIITSLYVGTAVNLWTCAGCGYMQLCHLPGTKEECWTKLSISCLRRSGSQFLLGHTSYTTSEKLILPTIL